MKLVHRDTTDPPELRQMMAVIDLATRALPEDVRTDLFEIIRDGWWQARRIGYHAGRQKADLAGGGHLFDAVVDVANLPVPPGPAPGAPS